MLDLRKPIGAYFLINAVILLGASFTTTHQSKIGDFTMNLDLVWGLVMAAFGALMLGLSLMENKSKKS